MSKNAKSVSRSVESDSSDKNTKKNTKVDDTKTSKSSEKKSSTKSVSSSKTPSTKSVKEEEVVVEPPKTEKKKRVGKSAAGAASTDSKTETVDVKSESDASASGSESKTKRRREVSVTSVESEFDAILDLLRDTVESSRSADKKKNVSVKVLRQLGKRLKVLKTDCLRISKQRRVNRQKNTSSGFMKPVKVSDEMAKFANWDPSQLRSRIDATKYICQYIRDKKLQKPGDGRIVMPDDKLAKLLHFDAKDGKELTYYYIQKLIQRHFSNPTA